MMMMHDMMVNAMMMHGMMNKSIVATPDGGVIIVMGNKLLKYDKDLNLVKEVEIKMDMDGMHEMMKDMMGRGGKHHHDHDGDDDDDDDDAPSQKSAK